MSVFFIKIGLVAVGTEQDVRHPVRRSAHLFTDGFQVNVGAAFDDKLIMDVTDNETVPEGLNPALPENIRLSYIAMVPV